MVANLGVVVESNKARGFESTLGQLWVKQIWIMEVKGRGLDHVGYRWRHKAFVAWDDAISKGLVRGKREALSN